MTFFNVLQSMVKADIVQYTKQPAEAANENRSTVTSTVCSLQ